MVVAVESTGFTSRPAAESYVGGVCFKLGPPRLIGAELEWLTHHARSSPDRPDLASIAAALGPHAPKSVAPDSPARPLPAGSLVTVEPGGQIELSSAPHDSAVALCAALAADEGTLRALLARRSITAHAHAADSRRTARRLLELPRYRAMEERFEEIGPFGKLMMCNTAAVQVSVDAGADVADVARRWNLLQAVGPALIAAFACSPRLRGVPPGSGHRNGCGRGSSSIGPARSVHPSRRGSRPIRSPTTRAGCSTSPCSACAATDRVGPRRRVRRSRTGSTVRSTTRSVAVPPLPISTIT